MFLSLSNLPVGGWRFSLCFDWKFLSFDWKNTVTEVHSPAPSSLCPIERYISVNVRCPVCIPHRKYTGFLREHRRVIKGQLISALTYFYQCNGKMYPQLRGREEKTEAALRIQPKQCKIFWCQHELEGQDLQVCVETVSGIQSALNGRLLGEGEVEAWKESDGMLSHDWCWERTQNCYLIARLATCEVFKNHSARVFT